MAKEDIKQRIVLDGEKEYSAALKEAQRNLKVLRSELKAETAELGKNATEQQKNETRTKNLQKQIKEQAKIVRTYEKALEEVQKKYGDNADAVAKWEIKLNDARATLGKMKDGLTDTSKSMKDVGTSAQMSTVATNSLADSLGKVASAAGSISDAIENAFSGVVDRVRQTINAVWTELLDIAAKSDNYMDLAAYFGSSATEVQKWDSAMRAAAGDMSTVTSLITKLKYSGKEKNVAEWFGISAENYTNDLEYFQAVMQQMVEYRDEMKQNGTWDTAMADIFGNKKGFDVEGILSDWSAILEGLDKFDPEKGGYGLTEEQIQNMADLNLQVLTLKESWQSLKRMGLVHLFGDLAMNVTGNLQNIVDAFKEYFQAENDEERQEALDKIRTNIEEMFQALAKALEDGIALLGEVADNLKNSEDPMVRAFGEFLDKIVGAMEWAINPDNWETIKKGFEAIIGIWVTGKIVRALSNLASFVSHIKTIWQYNNGGGAPTAPTGGGGNGGNPTIPPAGGAGAGLKWLAPALKAAAPYAAGAAISALAFYGIAKGASANNYTFNGDYNSARYADVDNPHQMQTAVRGILGANDANAQWQLGYLAAHVSSPQELFDLFNYHDTKLGDTNWLLNAGGTSSKMAAAIYAMYEHRFGGLNTELANSLPPEWRAMLTAGQADYASLNASGQMDYATLLSQMRGFFEHYGTFNEKGEWTIPGLEELVEEVSRGLGDRSLYDVPAESWIDGQELNNNIGGLKTIPGLIEKAVARGISGIRVTMDGHEVGVLVAPTVSQEIARIYN